MEKVLLLALENYGSTFVEPKVELGARFGHLVCKCFEFWRFCCKMLIPTPLVRFLDIYQVTQALATVLQNPKQLADMRRAWSEIDFESVRNQSALVCNCRHEDLIQLLEVDFVGLLDGLQRTSEPVRDVMIWADECCERLMGASRGEDRSTLSSRSVLIRWGYVTSQIMRDLVGYCYPFAEPYSHRLLDYQERCLIRGLPNPQTILRVRGTTITIMAHFLTLNSDWIALNVLRAVALSTNSVAASVEPVIQQQFFTLSPPMASGDYSGTTGLVPGPIMDHNPASNSILAALNDTTYSAGPDSSSTSSFLDSGANSFVGSSAFGSLDGMNFMDHQSHNGGSNNNNGTGSDSLLGTGVDMTFGDFATTPSGFDVSNFTQEFVMSAPASGETEPTATNSTKEEETS